MNDNFGGQAEYNAIDFVKFIMALVVVAIHTEPFHGSSENIQVLFDTFSGLAVPFFFISSGFLLGKRVQENNNLMITVLTPTFNRGEVLRSLWDSLKKQTVKRV